MSSAKETFEIVMSSGSPELDGDVDRFDFTKTFHGDLDATGTFHLAIEDGGTHRYELDYEI